MLRGGQNPNRENSVFLESGKEKEAFRWTRECG